MKKQNKKPRSLLFRILIFIVKIPFFILFAGLTTQLPEEEESEIERLAKLDSTTIDPHPPKRR